MTTIAVSRAVLRLTAEDQAAFGWVATVLAALREGRPVAFVFVEDGSEPWFMLEPLADAIWVRDGAGRHVGTFGSVEAAVARGWARGGWLVEGQV